MDHQVSAAAIAGQLLDPGLSPRAFGPAPEAAPTTRWLGAADALGQLGLRPGIDVEEHDLVDVLGGRHIETGVRVLPEAVLYDLNFMAPRSLSFAWSQLDPGSRAEIEHAVRASAGTMLAHLSEHAPLVDGVRPPQSFIAAQVLHAIGTRSSLAGPIPPVLHVHNCLFAVLDTDGMLVAPHEPALADEDTQRECDAAAPADLADRLIGLGFQVRNTAGAGTGHSFELDGVPQALLDDEEFWHNTGCATGSG